MDKRTVVADTMASPTSATESRRWERRPGTMRRLLILMFCLGNAAFAARSWADQITLSPKDSGSNSASMVLACCRSMELSPLPWLDAL